MPSDPKSLKKYQQKRDFRATAEPAGSRQHTSDGALFVVQKHLAGNLHYDLRLEMDGVLKSWAVPKGPSLDPSVKRLAIHVEDHPLEYARFEGVIPEGEYGAGKVIVWDTGSWHVIQSKGHGYEQGNMKFMLQGEKLKGRWALVRIGEPSKNEWLLIKERDDYARSERRTVVTNDLPLSVLTGRDVNELTDPHKLLAAHGEASSTKAEGEPDRIDPASLSGAVQAPLPKRIVPQLATPTHESPEGDDWLHEIKLDGYRIVATKRSARAKLTTRNDQNWTDRFPTVAAAINKIDFEQFVIDGELVRLRKDGVSDFAALQTAVREGEESQLVYFAFDLLYLNGYSLVAVPLIERKSLLAKMLAPVSDVRVQFCDHIVGNGQSFFEKCRAAGLEGAISKKVHSRYQSGRGISWLKRKCLMVDDFVIAGYTKSSTRRGSVRSFLLGYFHDGQLVYVGKVGTGFSESMLDDLQQRCDAIETDSPAFAELPDGLDREPIVWCVPQLVARLHFLGWTSSQLLRHPAFIGLRTDAEVEDVVGPRRGEQVTPPVAQANKHVSKKQPSVGHVSPGQLQELSSFHITNPSKILFPFVQCSKLDIAKYYVGVAQWMLPYVQDRPVSFVRYPDGIEQNSFFQKHPLDGMHAAIDVIADGESQKPLLGVSSLLALVSAVQLAAIEFHPWSARKDRLDRPDRIIFDFDPDTSLAWQHLKNAACECREILKSVGLESFVKTSGGKGIHVVAPLERRNTWDQVLKFAKAVAKQMVAAAGDRYTTSVSKPARKNKILIDVLRNSRGSTCAAAYSVRATHNASVSMPVDWKDLEAIGDPSEFDVFSVSQLVAKRTSDPWEKLYLIRQGLSQRKLAQLATR